MPRQADRPRPCCARPIGPASSSPGSGFGLIYAGLDQGNRLDWLNSGVVTGLLLGGALLVVAFIVREPRADTR